MSDTTPEREYRSCLNCKFAQVCVNAEKLSKDTFSSSVAGFGVYPKMHSRFFDNHIVVENEIKDVIGKHCKLFKAIEKKEKRPNF